MLFFKKNKNKIQTYSKILLSTLVFAASVWITWSYILATHAQLAYGNSDPLVSLSEEVCRTILGAVIAYCTKAGVENVFKGFTGDDAPSADTQPVEDPEAVG